jgi:acetoacetyl-CoA synthetase
VPSLIVAVPELPKTRSGKMTELAVADIVTGRPERDTSSLANPESLDWFREWATATRS